MLPPVADRAKLRAILEQLASGVEELLLGGLTTATDATRQTVNAALQEAARFKLLRLGSALRVTSEELGRFTKQDPSFSRKRLAFFLNRAWLLARGLSHALKSNEEAEFDRLNWSPPTQPVAAVDVVCVGAVKKVAAGSFVAFDFRLRAVQCTHHAPRDDGHHAERDEYTGPIKPGQRLTWSAVFPIKPGMDIPPEGFLHLPQKQKFTPFLLLEKKTIAIRNASVSLDESAGRIMLNEQSTVAVGSEFKDWPQFIEWSPLLAIERIKKHKPGPLDLDTELQEEIVLREYQIGSPENGDEPGQTAYPITAASLTLRAIVGPDVEGKALKKSLEELRKVKKNQPALYGLMHYERCRLAFQPLTTFGTESLDYLQISKENINKAALLKAMSFT